MLNTEVFHTVWRINTSICSMLPPKKLFQCLYKLTHKSLKPPRKLQSPTPSRGPLIRLHQPQKHQLRRSLSLCHQKSCKHMRMAPRKLPFDFQHQVRVLNDLMECTLIDKWMITAIQRQIPATYHTQAKQSNHSKYSTPENGLVYCLRLRQKW